MKWERGHRAAPEPGPRGRFNLKDMTLTERRLTVRAPMSDGLKLLGRHLRQDVSTWEISASMSEYCADLVEVKVRVLTEAEISDLRSINGKLSWAARQSRPCLVPGVVSSTEHEDTTGETPKDGQPSHPAVAQGCATQLRASWLRTPGAAELMA